MNRLRFSIAAALILGSLLLASPPVRGEDPAREEYLVKAAFIYNFAKFVEWPQTAFPDEKAPLIFTVLGKDPFGDTLDSLANKTVRGRPIEVRRTARISDLAPCHILFISPSEQVRLAEIQLKTRGWPVLSISDMDAFTRQGGVVQFIVVQSKIRFSINPQPAETNGLHISSQLLRLAQPAKSDS